MLINPKTKHVQRLYKVRSIGGEGKQDDSILSSEVNKLVRSIRVIIIEEKKAKFPLSFLSSKRFEVLEPLERDFIVSIAGFGNSNKVII